MDYCYDKKSVETRSVVGVITDCPKSFYVEISKRILLGMVSFRINPDSQKGTPHWERIE